MPNWCITSYTFVGEKKEIKELHDLMKGLEQISEPLVENGFGTTWLGCLVEALGKKWEDVRCRGEWNNLELTGDVLRFSTMTAWCAAEEVMDLICEKYPSLFYYYYTEEPGCCIYQTNDDCGCYYPYRYYIDLCTADETYCSEYFLSMEAALEWIGKQVSQSFGSEEDVNIYFEELRKTNENAFCYFHEIEVIY